MPSLLESLSSAHLEAMAWGKPQVVSDLPYAHDLCGSAAIYVDPNSPSDWAREIERVGKDSALVNRLVIHGKERIKKFPSTWSDSAKMVREFFMSIRHK